MRSKHILILMLAVVLSACYVSDARDNQVDPGSDLFLGTPTNLIATPLSSTQILLTWSEADIGTGALVVERKIGAGGTYEKVATLSTATGGAALGDYSETGLTPSTRYDYRVYAAMGARVSAYTNEASATTQAPPPTVPVAPTLLVAAALSASQIQLTWSDNAGDEEGYEIERKTGAGGAYVSVAKLAVDSIGFTNTGLAASTPYYYRVHAFSSVGNSADSNEANVITPAVPTTVPIAPTNLVATAQSTSQINLAWTDNAGDEDGYKVERKTGVGGAYAVVATLGPGAVSYQNTGLTASTAYYYRVYAYNVVGNSTNSNEVNATTQAPPTMVSIPGGTFGMGDALDGTADAPVHSITLSAFEMDVKEVSNVQYKACVTAGGCTAPSSANSQTHTPYYGNATYDNYPVIYVNWSQATVYCAWAGKRLPTEAEWEYAARGGLAGKRFPWGDTIDCTNANYYTTDSYAYDVDPYVGSKYCSPPNDTNVGGSYAANGYGLYDMAGNVLEWGSDWYDSGYYSVSPSSNPPGPATGTLRVRRGGYWSSALFARVSYRAGETPTTPNYHTGFRCAR